MFNKQTLAAFIGTMSLASARTIPVTDDMPSLAEVEAAAATVVPYSPVSNVKGLAFDKFHQIWFENQDYKTTAEDSNFAKIAKEGILLTNYFATTHPSQPNYVASAAGDNFGMDNDDFHQIPANVSTIADLFDTKGISWGQYQEALPYAGYQGYNFSNQKTMANDYMRKHDPLIIFESVTNDDTRPRQIKNFTSFYDDLDNHRIPQYSFITPNMTNDCHDTDIEVGGDFLASFLSPLLKNEYFNKDTLILVTFDETGNYTEENRVYSILLGGAVPEHLKGTTDDTFYTHYSIIASLSANWGLPSLGRWDCGANILKLVAEKTGFVNWDVDLSAVPNLMNETYPGPMSENDYSDYEPFWPIPETERACNAGHGIVDVVKETYHRRQPSYNYISPVPYDLRSKYNVGIPYSRTVNGKKETGITN
ncbi:uncharacterized protein N7484_001211 [Penicillium longicatenatum]|uniref:uncharacterized protein n=1 Tax=Penicillium longicatenatum TaxID=1561947 RepID=UPI0025477B5A|nr:uncharacterized protein N7484_001211 [Penicillium longicatenatum]KAJ5657562.1 hypothetical protein N7484_001211 [Penicillium longicatenatum]